MNNVADLISKMPVGSVARASAVAPVAGVLPVPEVLRAVLPGGLRRSVVVELGVAGPIPPGRTRVEGVGYATPVAPGGCSLLLLLLARVSAAGSWGALVNAPGVGLVAAAEVGVELGRLALVPEPGRDWMRVVGTLLDGFDLVAVFPPERPRPADQRWLTARVRQHGAVLVSLGPWAGADVRLWPAAGEWAGPGTGHGRLAEHRLSVSMAGRGSVGSRSASLHLGAGWLASRI
jgi:hypothetical protein